MWRLKGCPKCRGDLFLGQDMDGWCVKCLQCGYARDIGHIGDLRSMLEVEKEPDEAEREPVLAGAGGEH